ncbi:TPA: hypothetical protein ACY38O_000806 [Pasteurella multocida]
MGFLDNILEPKLKGNCRRIKEFNELGLRPDAIVQEFRKQGINISINMVNVVLNDEISEMKKKAFPKSVVKEKRKEIQEISSAITGTGL